MTGKRIILQIHIHIYVDMYTHIYDIIYIYAPILSSQQPKKKISTQEVKYA